ncbi:unnamed protein product, partial [Ectocarpus sp. 6 AP-2014]
IGEGPKLRHTDSTNPTRRRAGSSKQQPALCLCVRFRARRARSEVHRCSSLTSSFSTRVCSAAAVKQEGGNQQAAFEKQCGIRSASDRSCIHGRKGLGWLEPAQRRRDLCVGAGRGVALQPDSRARVENC